MVLHGMQKENTFVSLMWKKTCKSSISWLWKCFKLSWQVQWNRLIPGLRWLSGVHARWCQGPRPICFLQAPSGFKAAEWASCKPAGQVPSVTKAAETMENGPDKRDLLFLNWNITFGFKHHGNWVSFLQTSGDSRDLGSMFPCFVFIYTDVPFLNIHKQFQNSPKTFFLHFWESWAADSQVWTYRLHYFHRARTSAKEWNWNWTCSTELRNGFTQ